MELWYSPWHNQIFYTYRQRVIVEVWDWGTKGLTAEWPSYFTYTFRPRYVNPKTWIKLDEEGI